MIFRTLLIKILELQDLQLLFSGCIWPDNLG